MKVALFTAVIILSLPACTAPSKSKNTDRHAAQATSPGAAESGDIQDDNNDSESGQNDEENSPTLPEPNTDSNFTANGDCYKADAFICQAEIACLKQTNTLRGSNRAALVQSAKFAFIARLWSKSQAEAGGISHDGFPNARAQAYEAEFGAGSSYGIYAENVAYSGSSDSNPEAIATMFTKMWWWSWGHHMNMISRNKVMGCGIWKDGNTYYATQIFGEE
jgi:hypothetical protein